jgi:uncharacterized membrane protein
MSKRWIGLVFILATLVFGAVVFDRLPAQVATHFNAQGEPDGYSSRAFAVWGLAALPFGLLLLFNGLPRVMPRRENFGRFEDTYWFIVNMVIAFICAFNVVILGNALGWGISIPTTVLLGMGALFIILGNLLPRTRSNWFMGIRTPWTLDSERVWRETHRLGGRTFMAGGLVTVFAAFMPPAIQPWIAMGALIVAGFIPVVYSYIAWRREKQAEQPL